MTSIYLIRHAEAEGNIFRRMDGHYNSRITRNGQRQIAALERRFASIPIDAVYASDLFRTCETAKALYVPKGLPLHKDARFREIWFGEVEDLNFGWMDYFTPAQMRNFSKAPEQWYAEGAELYPQACGRLIGGLQDLAKQHDGQTIAVFTHGGVTAWALRALFGERMKTAGRCDNTGVCLLSWENGGFTPEFFYDNSHLSPEISTLAHQAWWRGTNEFNLWFRDVLPEDAELIDPAFPLPETGIRRIAMRMDEPVGYLSYTPETGEIAQLYLVPQHRHKRMGDQLMGEIVCPCRALGRTRLTAAVDPANRDAVALLLRHGAHIENGRATMEITLPEY